MKKKGSRSGVKRKNWEPWERQTVVERIQANPNNFEQAFDEASTITGRTTNAVRQQFIKFIRPELKKQNVAITIQGSSHSMLVNSKNTPRRKSDKFLMVKQFGQGLTKEEKKELIAEWFSEL